MNACKLALFLAACEAPLNQGASCKDDTQCAGGLVCLRAVCLNQGEVKIAWSPDGTVVPPGAVIHERAAVIHPRIHNSNVTLNVAGAVETMAGEILVGDTPVRVSSPELRRETYFDVVPHTLTELDSAKGWLVMTPDGLVVVPGFDAQPVYWNGEIHGAVGNDLANGSGVVASFNAPPKLAVSGNRLFIAEADRVRVFDSSGTMDVFVELAARQIGVAGDNLWVASEGAWYVFSIGNGEQRWAIEAPFTPTAVANGDGDYIWVAGPTFVARVYLDGLGWIRFLDQVSPVSLAQRPSGDLILNDASRDALLRFAPATK